MRGIMGELYSKIIYIIYTHILHMHAYIYIHIHIFDYKCMQILFVFYICMHYI